MQHLISMPQDMKKCKNMNTESNPSDMTLQTLGLWYKYVYFRINTQNISKKERKLITLHSRLTIGLDRKQPFQVDLTEPLKDSDPIPLQLTWTEVVPLNATF